MNAEQILNQLQWRYATKKFNPNKKIAAADWQALEQSLVLSPSSFGMQPWKFFVVENSETRQEILPHAWGQKQVVDASHLVVLAIKLGVDGSDVERQAARMAEVQQVPTEKLSGYEDTVKSFLKDPPFPFEVNSWSTRQVYLALGMLLHSAAALEIDSCPMEGFVPKECDRILGLPEQGYHSVVLCALGYRAEDDKAAERAKVRFPTSEVVQYIK